MRLAEILKVYMRVNCIGTRELARELEMSAATLSRIVNGENCEMRNFAKLFAWLVETDHTESTPAVEHLLALKAVVAASAGLKCPNCDDTGYFAVQVAVDVWEQEPCQFCYDNADSVFMRRVAKEANK